jgi:hypothetical protein
MFGSKWLYVGLAFVVAAVVGGVTTAKVTSSSAAPCQVPQVFFESDSAAALVVIDTYIEQNIVPTFKHPAKVIWASEDYAPKVTGKELAFQIGVGEGQNSVFGAAFTGPEKLYNIVVTRDCVGGGWKVTKFTQVKV